MHASNNLMLSNIIFLNLLAFKGCNDACEAECIKEYLECTDGAGPCQDYYNTCINPTFDYSCKTECYNTWYDCGAQAVHEGDADACNDAYWNCVYPWLTAATATGKLSTDNHSSVMMCASVWMHASNNLMLSNIIFSNLLAKKACDDACEAECIKNWEECTDHELSDDGYFACAETFEKCAYPAWLTAATATGKLSIP